MPNWVGNRELDVVVVVVAIIILRTMRIYCTIFAYTESCLAANFIYRSITDDDDADEEENCQKENWKAANRQLATVQVSMQLLYSIHIPYTILYCCILYVYLLFIFCFPFFHNISKNGSGKKLFCICSIAANAFKVFTNVFNFVCNARDTNCNKSNNSNNNGRSNKAGRVRQIAT